MTTAAMAAAPSTRTPVYSWIVLGMLLFIYIFNFLDRQLMSTLQEYIKADLGLSDSQLGLMTGFYFALFYTGFGVVVGFLADRTSRVRILFAGCFLWSLFTALCGVAKTYPVLLTARMGVGVGEAAGAPPSYSIISDYFPAHRRGMALALFSLGVPFGMALGAGFGAKIADLYSWRHAFVGIGIAGILASFALLAVVREPKRGAQDAKPAVATGPGADSLVEQPGFITTIKDFFSNPVLLWTALGCGLSAFVGYAGLNWNVSFLMRVKEMPGADIAAYYALLLAVTMGAGTFISGALVDFLAKRSRVWYGLLPAIAMILCVPFHLGFVWAPTWPLALVFLSGPFFLNIFYLAPALAVVQNTVKPSQRTMAGALLLMVLNIIGLGGGPTMMGFLSDYFGASQGSAQGLQTAFYWLTPFYVFAFLLLLMMARALSNRDKNEAAVAAAAAA